MIAKRTKTVLFALAVAAVLIPTAVMQYVEASNDECPDGGMNGEHRCYAVKNYIPDGRPTSVNVDIVADDISVTGFIQNALWSHLSDNRFIEAGFIEMSSNSEKIVCGEEGNIDEATAISFSDGHRFNAYVYDLRNGVSWKIGIEHRNSNTEEACTTVHPYGTYMKKFRIGSEASRPDTFDYEHEWDDLEIDHQDVDSDDFSSVWLTEDGPDYKVEECGSGDERYGHIQTGKGDISTC